MSEWVSKAVLEKAAREKSDPSASSLSSLKEDELRPLGRPPNISASVLQTAKIQAAIAGKTVAVWLSEALFEKADRDGTPAMGKPDTKKLVHT